MSEDQQAEPVLAEVEPGDPLAASPPEPASPPPPPPAPRPGLEPRKPEEFFSFRQGDRERFADPMAVQRRLHSALGGEDLGAKFNSFESDSREAEGLALDAAEFLARVSREAFRLEPFDEDTGRGWTEAASIGLLYDFLEWQAGKVVSGDARPNSSPLTDSLPTTS